MILLGVESRVGRGSHGAFGAKGGCHLFPGRTAATEAMDN